ncbi:MAG TPA: outer membrane beta-barrel protein, partial [Candidatus Limnocylindrales bacterium]|nr:outer membrane beta-barrel protein [Candidatus Limnocylindrales bacterium]
MRSMMRVAAAFLLAALVAAPASAGEPRRHDGGFFLRLAPGGGYSRTAIDEAGERFAFKGPSGSFDLAIGAVVKENLAIHATLGAWAVVDPTVEFFGLEEEVRDTSVTMSMLGGGFTYYFGPSNVYLTASAGAAVLSLEFEGDTEDSDTGIAFDVGLGKEWWVSDRWGLGASAT